MNLLNPIFLVSALGGACFVIAALIMSRFPPKAINEIYGYRTRRSMRSQENWDFAQQYSAREMKISGLILMICSPAGLFCSFGTGVNTGIALFMLIICAAVPIVRTEKQLKVRFKLKS